MKTKKIEEQHYKIPVVRIGTIFAVDEMTCQDVDILNWLEEQPKNEFEVSYFEYENNGVWIDNCDYRFDMNEIEIIKY